MSESIVDTLLAADSISEAQGFGRRSGTEPEALASLLEERARNSAIKRPATAAAATFLALSFRELSTLKLWEANGDLPGETNSTLLTASSVGGWSGALEVLRERRSHFDFEVFMSVVSWHVRLANQGVPPKSNGISLVIVLGALLGGQSLIMAQLTWARACERDSTAHAAFHIRRAHTLAARAGDSLLLDAANRALSSLSVRNGGGAIPTGDPTGTGSSDELSIPRNESYASDLRDAGQYRDALGVLDETIATAKDWDVKPSLMRMHNVRGLVHDDLSEYILAEADFRESARLAGELRDSSRRFEALTNLAASFLKRGQALKALPPFKSLKHQADGAGVWHLQIAARNNLAHAYKQAGDTYAAYRLYREALDLLGASINNGSYWIATQGLIETCDELDYTEERANLVLRVQQAWIDSGDELALRTLLFTDNGTLLAEPRYLQAAQAFWLDAIDSGRLGEAGALSLRLSRHEFDLKRQPQTTTNWKIWRNSLRSRERSARQAVSILDAFLDRFPNERTSTTSCITAECEAARLEFAVGQDRRGVDRLRAAIAAVEARLAQVPQAYDRDWVLDSARPLYTNLMDHLIRLGGPTELDECFWLHEALRPSTLTSHNQADVSTNPSEAVASRRVAEARDVFRVLKETGEHVRIVSFAEIDERIGLFVLTSWNECIEWIEIDVSVSDIVDARSELSAAFNGDPSCFPPRKPTVVRRGVAACNLTKLDDVCARLGAALRQIGDDELVCVIPSTTMEGMPLHALVLSDGRRLIERTYVVYQPSCSSLVANLPVSRTPKTDRVFAAGVAAREDDHPDFFEHDADIFSILDASVDVVAGKDATPHAVLQGLSSCNVAHVASHGYVDLHDPLGSGLLLSDGQRRPSREPTSVPIFERGAFELTVRDLLERRLDISLLTLRACSTARRSTVSVKEEIATLSRVLQYAGVRTLVTTLWNVDQQSSLRLFRRFYELCLHEGEPAVRAMARAQREMIKCRDEESHLYHWAPFIVSGDWRTGD